MPGVVLTLFRHTNHRVSVPNVFFHYYENGTETRWMISARVDTAYFVRIGPDVLDERRSEQVFDATLMCRSLECSFMLGSKKVVRFEKMGFLGLKDATVEPSAEVVFGHLGDDEPPDTEVIGWFKALSTHIWLRRAAEDVYLAALMEDDAEVPKLVIPTRFLLRDLCCATDRYRRDCDTHDLDPYRALGIR